MNYDVFIGDIPDNLDLGKSIAVDTEAMGLNIRRDRLCVVQIADEKGYVCLVQFKDGNYSAPNLRKLLADPSILKIFHYARFDLAILKHYLDVEVAPIYCTKIASRLARTYTDRHGLKDLVREVVGREISKQQQTSYWGTEHLTKEQIQYAAGDVIYLHSIRDELNKRLKREGRFELAERAFGAVMIHALLDIAGWDNVNVFSYQ